MHGGGVRRTPLLPKAVNIGGDTVRSVLMVSSEKLNTSLRLSPWIESLPRLPSSSSTKRGSDGVRLLLPCVHPLVRAASTAANSTESSQPRPRRRGRRRYERRVLRVNAGREADFVNVRLPPVLLPKSKTLLCVYGDELNTAVEKERNFLARGAEDGELEELLEAALDGVPRCLLCVACDGQLLHPCFHSLSPIYN